MPEQEVTDTLALVWIQFNVNVVIEREGLNPLAGDGMQGHAGRLGICVPVTRRQGVDDEGFGFIWLGAAGAAVGCHACAHFPGALD